MILCTCYFFNISFVCILLNISKKKKCKYVRYCLEYYSDVNYS